MSKLQNDKYYTPKDLAWFCVERVKEVVGEENITEFLEPSGGNGVFLDFLPHGTYSCDIEPEDDRIMKQDYLELELEYKKGRCVIGNPPFGRTNSLAKKFYRKSIQLGDYIAFILPISQLDNNIDMYEFDMIHSEDLGKREYSDRKVHCCFNIYKRNDNGYNNKPNYDLKDVKLRGISTGEARKLKDTIPKNYDFSICSFGSIGKICEYENQYCQQIYFTVKNEKYKEEVFELIKNTDWYQVYKMPSIPKLKLWMINKYLKEQIPELE